MNPKEVLRAAKVCRAAHEWQYGKPKLTRPEVKVNPKGVWRAATVCCAARQAGCAPVAVREAKIDQAGGVGGRGDQRVVAHGHPDQRIVGPVVPELVAAVVRHDQVARHLHALGFRF